MEFSVVTSIYRDGYLARNFCIEIAKVFSEHLGQNQIEDGLEIIFVNDGSPDDSLLRLLELKDEFEFVKVIDLSRILDSMRRLRADFGLLRGAMCCGSMSICRTPLRRFLSY